LSLLGFEEHTDIITKIGRAQATHDRVSLIRWLRRDGGRNDLVENTLLALHGFSPLAADDPKLGQ